MARGRALRARLLTEIIAKCDSAIDLHAGDLSEDLVPFVIYRETQNGALNGRIQAMADAYGARWAVKSAPTGERPGSLMAVAAENGVAAMLAESGGRGQLIEEDVVRHVTGVTNILRTIGAISGRAARVEPPTASRASSGCARPSRGYSTRTWAWTKWSRRVTRSATSPISSATRSPQ